jgi:OOP family OmpA-OmpF porin
MLPLQRAQMRLTRQDLAVSGLSHRKDTQAVLALSVRQILPNTVRTDLQITYQPPPKTEPDLLPAARCISQINGLLQSEKINFDPGSDRVNLAGQNLLDKIAEILRQCGEIPLEIAGHTDSQGREEMNLQLSQMRAHADMMELQRRRILTGSFLAQGYGETKPIAANDSAEGRDINRRIEFYLRENEPAPPVQGDPETLPAEVRINANAGQ